MSIVKPTFKQEFFHRFERYLQAVNLTDTGNMESPVACHCLALTGCSWDSQSLATFSYAAPHFTLQKTLVLTLFN